jgi:hypothetical protein
VLLAIWLIDRSGHHRRPAAWLAGASAAAVLAAVHHQAFGLAALPCFAAIVVCGRRRNRTERVRRGLAFAGPTLVLVLAIFGTAFRASGEKSFVLFLRGYEAWMQMLPYDSLQPLTPIYAGIGIARCIVFPDVALRFDPIYRAVQSRIPHKLIFDDKYLLGDMSLPAVIVTMVAASLACLLFAGLLIVAIRHRRSYPRTAGFWALLGWVAVQTAFFAAWEPSSNEFWIWLVPCLALLVVAPAVGRLQAPVATVVPALLIASLALANAPVVRRYGDPERCIFRANKTYLTKLDADDLVISGDGYPMNWFWLLYPTPATELRFYRNSFSLADSTLQVRLTSMPQSRSGRIFLDPPVAMPDAAELALQSFFVGNEIHVDVATSERDLVELEARCREAGIPLFGILRKGRDLVAFHQRPFTGWLRWVDPDSITPLSGR